MSLKTKKFYFPLFIKILILILSFIILTSCKKENKIYTENIRVGVALYSQEDTFISSVAQNLEKLVQIEEAKRKNLKITLTIADGKRNQTTQLEQIDQFLKRNYDILCVNIVDRTAASVIIDKAKENNTAIIFFNRQPVSEDMLRWEKTYYVGCKAEQSGILQGELVLSAWNENKEIYDKNNDNIIQYIMLEGEPSHQDTLLRSEYSIKVLKENSIKTQKLASDTANWNKNQAQNLTSQWINQFGNTIEVVFANNDDMALGAIDAFKNANLPIPLIVGVDAIEQAIEAIQNGFLYATVKNDSESISKNILNLILDIYYYKKPSENVAIEDNHYIWVQYEKITVQTLKK